MELTTPRALKWIRARMVIVAGVLACGFVAIAYRAVQLQVRESPKLKALAEEQYMKMVEIPPRRGSVLFRDGAELAISLDVESVWVNPRVATDDREVATRLADALHLDVREVASKLAASKHFLWLKRRVAPEEAQAVRALDIDGVDLTPEPRRYYPNGALAGPVIGFAGIDAKGLDGVELTQDETLRGSKATIPGLRDALGRVVLTGGMPDTPITAGGTVVLTIDRFIQFSAERALAAGVRQARGRAGMAVVMDPRTGEVLAIASVPTYDPNRPINHVKIGARNRAVTDAFEPGSTMKIFTVAAGLEERVVGAFERIDTEDGEMRVGKYIIHDSHDHEYLTVSDCIQKSSNICSAKIAKRVGRDRIAEYLHAFGFGTRSGIELPGERAGTLRQTSRWGEIGLATVSFGQGMTATALQVLAGFNTIASGGIYFPPRLVRRVIAPTGETVSELPANPEGRRVVSERVARELTKMLVSVTEKGGTAELAAMTDFSVAGKTGTAQKVDGRSGRYGKGMFVASFAGYVPAESPRLTIIVVIDEPDAKSHYGGDVAGPVFKRIAEESLNYLGVTHQNRTVAQETQAPPAALITETIPEDPVPDEPKSVNDKVNVNGGVDVDVHVDVDVNANASANTMIPNFTGMTLGQALAAARRAGLRIEVTGSGVAIGQSPNPGPAPRGARCRIAFRPPSAAANPKPISMSPKAAAL